MDDHQETPKEMNIEEKIKETQATLDKVKAGVEKGKEEAAKLTKTLKEFTKLLEKAKQIEG